MCGGPTTDQVSDGYILYCSLCYWESFVICIRTKILNWHGCRSTYRIMGNPMVRGGTAPLLKMSFISCFRVSVHCTLMSTYNFRLPLKSSPGPIRSVLYYQCAILCTPGLESPVYRMITWQCTNPSIGTVNSTSSFHLSI